MRFKNSILYFLLLSITTLLVSCSKSAETKTSCLESENNVDNSKSDRKVLIIGIDGFRSDVLTVTNAPFLDEYGSRPTTYYNNLHKTENITLSGPNWISILNGVHVTKHGVPGNLFNGEFLTEYPSFFKYIELAKPNIKTVSISHWLPINEELNLGLADYCPIDPITDLEVFNRANAIINQQDNIEGDVIFLHFDDLDFNGHSFGFHDTIPEYVNAVTTTDGYVGNLINSVESRRSQGEDWLVIVVSDHGGEGTGHGTGSLNPVVNQTIFFANHPTENFIENHISTQVDIAPTVLSFLGIGNDAFNCKKDGISLIE